MFKSDKNTILRIFCVSFFFMVQSICIDCNAQNTKIKCYFNHPVNTVIATGINAVYLNSAFDDTVAAYINRAKYTIDIALYNYTSNSTNVVAKIATAANAAAARGVVVRWIYDGNSTNSGLTLLNSTIKTLASPLSSSVYNIMHNKFMVIDVNSPDEEDAVVLTGSYNWSSAQTYSDYNNIVFFQDQPLALAFYAEFNKMWGGTGPLPDYANSRFGVNKTPSAQNTFNVNGTMVEVYFSPKDPTGIQLQNAINTSNHDLFFGIYTFTDNAIANAIKNKYNSGITVKGIMDQFSVTYSAYSVLAPVLGSNMIVYATSDLYHNKIMLIDAFSPESDPQVFTGSFNWSGAAQTKNDEHAVIIHDGKITNQFYQSLCKDYTDLGGVPCNADPCPGKINVITSNLRGAAYQWQLNTGSGFANISDNVNYAGTSALNLYLNNPPSSWYGYQYRCLVNGVSSDTTTVKFIAYWNGAVNTLWENPGNWNCGKIPDANTDVIINYGVPNFPFVNSTTPCKSLKMNIGSKVTVTTGNTLLIMGH